MNAFDSFLMMLMNSHKNMQKLMNDCFAPLGLKCPAAICLRLINNCEGGISASGMSGMSGYDKALISRNCTELKRLGLIARNPEDCGVVRGYRLILTEKGEELIGQMDEAISKVTETVTNGIPSESLGIFYSTAEKMADNIIRLSK